MKERPTDNNHLGRKKLKHICSLPLSTVTWTVCVRNLQYIQVCIPENKLQAGEV